MALNVNLLLKGKQHSMLVTKANKYKVKSWPVLAFYDAATELM